MRSADHRVSSIGWFRGLDSSETPKPDRFGLAPLPKEELCAPLTMTSVTPKTFELARNFLCETSRALIPPTDRRFRTHGDGRVEIRLM